MLPVVLDAGAFGGDGDPQMKAQTIHMPGYDQIASFHDSDSGLTAYIAVHSTALGPSMGGVRMRPYASEGEALRDVLQLSRAMTYKAAAAGLQFGGGKSVIVGDPERNKSPELWKAFGACVEIFEGRYIAGEDMGTTPEDMDEIAQVTRHVMGESSSCGGLGDPAPYTAQGVLAGIRATLKWRFGDDGLEGVRVAVQGAGSVGMKLVEALHREGAQLLVGDPCEERVGEAVNLFSAQAVPPGDIYKVRCDLFVPCAMGGTLNGQSVQELRCAVVAGSANNQLSSLAAGEALAKRGILYAPDYVINAGGLIAISMPLSGLTPADRDAKIEGISDRLTRVFTRAEQAGIRPEEAADQLSEDVLQAAEAKRFRPSGPKSAKRPRAHSGFSM